MAMYDRQYFLDVRAILDKASVLKVEPKQSIEPVKVESPAPPAPYAYGQQFAANAIGNAAYQGIQGALGLRALNNQASAANAIGLGNQLANLNNQGMAATGQLLREGYDF